MINTLDSFMITNLGVAEYDARLGLMVLAGACVFCLALRIIISFAYQAQRSLLKFSAKELKKKSDIKPTKHPLLNKVIKDYKDLGEKGIANINTIAITENYVNRLGLIGISLPGLERFVKDFEAGLPFIGFILAVIFDYPRIFGGFAIGVFVLNRLLSAIFDFSAVRAGLIYDISGYVDREVGQYFIGDFASAISRLKVELVVAVSNQGAFLSTAIEDLGKNLSSYIKTSMEQIAENVNLTMESLSNFGANLEAPLESWSKAIEASGEAQREMNYVFEHFKSATSEFDRGAEELNRAIGSYGGLLENHSVKIIEQLKVMENISASLFEKNDAVEKMIGIIRGQAEYLEKNQNALSSSVESYELSLKEITANIGGALGSIIGHHVEQSYYALNDDLKNNIRAIAESNSQVIDHIEKAASHMLEYNQSQINALMQIKGEMRELK